MSHIRTFLRANYTFCAYKRFLIDKNLRLTCFISKLQGQSQCKRNFNTSSLWRNKESRKSGNIADILVKESSLETLVDPTGAGIDMTGKLDRSQYYRKVTWTFYHVLITLQFRFKTASYSFVQLHHRTQESGSLPILEPKINEQYTFNINNVVF